VKPNPQKSEATKKDAEHKSGEDKSKRDGGQAPVEQPKNKRKRPSRAKQTGVKPVPIFSECKGGPLVEDIEISEESVIDVFKIASDGLKVGEQEFEGEEMAEMNEEEEEIFQDLDAVDDEIGDAPFTEEDLFGSFM
jgi:hypothetical protein